MGKTETSSEARGTRIALALEALQPSHLKIMDESHMHNVPLDAATHFRVVLVSPMFVDQRTLSRHRLVYRALHQELANGLHALALETHDPDEWAAMGEVSGLASPQCMGGSQD